MYRLCSILLVLFLVACDYQSNSEDLSKQNNPNDPSISDNATYAGQVITILDPQGRIQNSDIMVFYPQTGTALNDGIVANNINVMDAYTMQAEVPEGLNIGVDHWVSVQFDINSTERFLLAFIPQALPNVSFSNQVFPIFSNYCSSCHSGVSPPAGLDLSTAVSAYDDLVNIASSQCNPVVNRVDPSSSSTSYLMNKLTGTGLCSGNQMPIGDTMSAEEIDTIRLWIDQGALDN